MIPSWKSTGALRSRCAGRAVVIDAAGLARGEVRLVDPVTEQEEPCPLRELMASPARVVEPASGGARA